MKWLLQIKNPRYALNAVLREFTFGDDRFLARFIGPSPRQIQTYLDEPVGTPAFAERLQAGEQPCRSLSIETSNLFAKKILSRRAAVRALAPDCIVETGIALFSPAAQTLPRKRRLS